MKYEDFDLEDGAYTMRSGKTLHIWTQRNYGQWACVAYDHGPFCRRCQKLGTTTAALIANVLDGGMDIEDDPDKGWLFKVTPSGKARVETAIRRGGFDKGLDG